MVFTIWLAMTNTPKIYVASLCDYNNSILHGEWIECDSLSQVEAKIEDMLAESPSAKKYGEMAEDWAIHDTEGFEGISIGQHESIEKICELAEKIAEYGEAFACYINAFGDDDVEEHYGDFEDRYQGCYESKEAFADEWFENCGVVDAVKNISVVGVSLDNYLDSDALVRDMEASGSFRFERLNGKVYVFTTN